MSKNNWPINVVSVDGKAAVSICFVKRPPTIRIWWFPKFITVWGSIKSAATNSEGLDTQWVRGVVLNDEHFNQRYKSANILFHKYINLRRSYVLFKPRRLLVK